MIDVVRIKDAVVFSEIELHLKPGLNVFSGVSGSGKSIFMQALLATFGIKDSNAQSLSARLSNTPAMHLEEFGIEEGENEITLSIIKKEKTRFFINSTPVSKKIYQELFSPFIKHISLKNATELQEQNLLETLDSSLPNAHQENLKNYKIKFRALKEAQQQLHSLQEEAAKIAQLREFAEFEIHKIEQINPKIGEYEELLELKKCLSKTEKLGDQITQALQGLESLSPIYSALKALGIPTESLQSEILQVQSLLEEQRERMEDLNQRDPEELLARIGALSDLSHRYGSIPNALEHLQAQRQKLQEYTSLHIHQDELKKRCQNLTQECHLLACCLHEARLKNLENFKNNLAALCHQLRLKAPVIELSSTTLQSSGSTQIALKLHHSSIDSLSMGEYNRLRLAIMTLQSRLNDKVGVLILDEIDANLSGEESDGVAQILKILSQSYQVFAISHQPHIPAIADAHYLVSKNDQTSSIHLLDKEGRIKEIARMISGAQVSKEALEFAKMRLEKI